MTLPSSQHRDILRARAVRAVLFTALFGVLTSCSKPRSLPVQTAANENTNDHSRKPDLRGAAGSADVHASDASANARYARSLAREVFEARAAHRCWTAQYTQTSCPECRTEGNLRSEGQGEIIWESADGSRNAVSLSSESYTKYAVGFLAPDFLDRFEFDASPPARIIRAVPKGKSSIVDVRYAIDAEQHVTTSVVVLDQHKNEIRTRFRSWKAGCANEGHGE